jgi:hypothetical protein
MFREEDEERWVSLGVWVWAYLRLSLFCATFVQRSCAFADCGVRWLTFHSLLLVCRSDTAANKAVMGVGGLPFVLGDGVTELGVDFSTPQIEDSRTVFPPFSRPFTLIVACLQRLIQRRRTVERQRRREQRSSCCRCHEGNMERGLRGGREAVGGWLFINEGTEMRINIGGNAIHTPNETLHY